ncbi:MAG: hypothetical protein JSV80_05550 [Acidobacteriota bacterium]|nr:MAG: hypothetical protein JSV80_05550 [Acidobacteriota bacterium]
MEGRAWEPVYQSDGRFERIDGRLSGITGRLAQGFRWGDGTLAGSRVDRKAN